MQTDAGGAVLLSWSTSPLLWTCPRCVLLRAGRREADARRAAARLDESRAWPDVHHHTVSTDRQSVTGHVEILHTSRESCHNKSNYVSFIYYFKKELLLQKICKSSAEIPVYLPDCWSCKSPVRAAPMIIFSTLTGVRSRLRSVMFKASLPSRSRKVFCPLLNKERTCQTPSATGRATANSDTCPDNVSLEMYTGFLSFI